MKEDEKLLEVQNKNLTNEAKDAKRKNKKNKKHLNELNIYIPKAEERVKYSIERFDVLVISLSSGGLLLGINLYSNFKNIDKSFISYSWLCFSVALIINLTSQITGYFANKYDIKYTRNLINKLENKKIVGNQCIIDIAEKIFDQMTQWLNLFSFISLTIGIIYLIIFVNYKI